MTKKYIAKFIKISHYSPDEILDEKYCSGSSALDILTTECLFLKVSLFENELIEYIPKDLHLIIIGFLGKNYAPPGAFDTLILAHVIEVKKT